MKIKLIPIPILLFIIPIISFSQSIKRFKIPDSIKDNSFLQLTKKYNKEFRKDSEKAEIYANSILLKGKKEKNYTKVADAYIMLHRLKNDDLALLYLDSTITIAKKFNNLSLLADSQMYKGNFYFLKGKYTQALPYYLNAREFSKKDSETYNIINFNIGLLKLELGNYKEAQNLFLDYSKYLEKEKQTKRLDYVSCLYAIAYTYSKMSQIGASELYIKKGLNANNYVKDKENYCNLLLVSGINSFNQKKYKESLIKLEKVSALQKQKNFNDQNLALSEFYIGKIFYKNNNLKYLEKFKVVDSIIIKSKNITSELRDVYPILIEYHKKNNDKEKQLLYVEHLLSVDSLINNNKYNLSTEINKKYDTQNLINEKEALISDLSSRNLRLYWLIGIVLFSLFVVIYFYVKNKNKVKRYKSKADFLLEKLSDLDRANQNKETIISPKIEELEKKKDNLKVTLNNDILNQIQIKLNAFENEKRFLDRKLNLEILSKELNTNRVYLSKVINELKGQNFSQYLNTLRINYIVNELKTNPYLQKYTITAIAEEAGFNNSESFTNAFKKITGTLPSYFLKALQEKE